MIVVGMAGVANRTSFFLLCVCVFHFTSFCWQQNSVIANLDYGGCCLLYAVH